MKIKIRHVIVVLIIALATAVTPLSIKMAYSIRGHVAYGGEYLLIPLGIALAIIFLELTKLWDSFCNEQKPYKLESEE